MRQDIMKQLASWNKKCCTTLTTTLCAAVFLSSGQVLADSFPTEMTSKIELYQEKLAKWSNDKDIIAAVKEMNARIVSMNNKTWKSLAKDNPKVMGYQQSTAGKKLTDWQKDKSLGKLFLRDTKGNFVAGSKKPAIYNIVDRKAFTKAITGKSWNSTKVKPDPTTNQRSIQISVPVQSNGKNIGIIHASLIVE